MPKKVVFLVSVLLLFRFYAVSVYGWSNGGSSSEPFDPKYGTHDWIAHHALDWLPYEEKQCILDNLASFLYGTELPDNGSIPDGVGDKDKHHVYYFANGSVQEDDSAVRAREEYINASNLLRAGDVIGAVRRLGMVCHYISDLGVYGHVMGSETAWGSEDDSVHGNYESYVDRRTESYSDDFNVYLSFDGVLETISAYNASLKLAFDTTFDDDGDLTCVWMSQNYDWNNPTFKNRCGESLNLAVNLIADVLHTFYMEEIIPEFPSILTLPLLIVVATFVILCTKKRIPRKRW